MTKRTPLERQWNGVFQKKASTNIDSWGGRYNSRHRNYKNWANPTGNPAPDPNSGRSKALPGILARCLQNQQVRGYKAKYRSRQIAWVTRWDKNWLHFIHKVYEARRTVLRLQDHRRENFCRLMATGSKMGEAYEKAGYKKNDGNSSKLFHNTEVQARIHELQLESTGGAIDALPAFISSAEKSEDAIDLTKTWVLEQLMLLAQNAKLEGQHSAAFRCLELIGEYLGMFGKAAGTKPEDNFKKADTAKKSANNLATLVQTFRQMDQEQKQNANPITDSKESSEDNTVDAEASISGAGDGTDTQDDIGASEDETASVTD